MSKFSYILIAICALFSISTTEAQTIALDERTPPIKKAKWLGNHVPAYLDFLYIEFILSESEPCRKSAERIFGIINEMKNIAFALVTPQKAADVAEWARLLMEENSGIIVEDDHICNIFGINYVPYAVLLDKSHRILWFGNPQTLDRQTIAKLTQQ